MEKCVKWHLYIDGEGYGRKYLPRSENGGKSKYIPAHKWVYQQHHGQIPKGMVVMHTCDNPSCVNIEHLQLGTHGDNMRDMWSKGRARWQIDCGYQYHGKG